jgi:hypothetical protein
VLTVDFIDERCLKTDGSHRWLMPVLNVSVYWGELGFLTDGWNLPPFCNPEDLGRRSAKQHPSRRLWPTNPHCDIDCDCDKRRIRHEIISRSTDFLPKMTK